MGRGRTAPAQRLPRPPQPVAGRADQLPGRRYLTNRDLALARRGGCGVGGGGGVGGEGEEGDDSASFQ